MSLVLYHDTYICTSPSTEAAKAKGHLVFLHGWGMNSLVWDELIPLLNTDYDVTLIDLPGLGRSPIASGVYDLNTVTEQVLKVAPEKTIWIGWSLGALIVQHINALYPERLQKAFLIAGTPRFVANEQWPYAMPLNVFEKFQALLEEDWQGTLIRFLTLQCKGSESIKEDTRKLREYLFHHGLPANKALREGLNILKDNDLQHALKNNRNGLHFILGEYDTLIPSKVKTTLESMNEYITVDIISGASHVPHLSHPQQVHNCIRQYLERE